MKTKNYFSFKALTSALGILIIGSICQRASAQLYSIDSSSPSTGSVSPSDVLSPGPTVALSSTSLGLASGDDMRDFTYSETLTNLYFSVDRATVGVSGGAVNSQSTLNQAAGDIYYWPVNGTTLLQTNQDQLGLVPLVGPETLNSSFPIDNVDGLVIRGPSTPTANGLYYVLAPGSPTLGLIGATTADILTTVGGVPTIAVLHGQLGLSTSDEIEGLSLVGSEWFITLAPGSPELALISAHSSDILGDFATGGNPFIALTHNQLGLLTSDNVDAISFVPEPSSGLLVGLGLLTLCGARGFRLWRRS